MRTLALSVVDLVQNSLRCGSTFIEIELINDSHDKMLKISIKDNGYGMGDDELESVTDPFYTTCETHKVGLGVPLFIQRAILTGGSYEISSKKGIGTEISAIFNVMSVDFVPLGNMSETLICLIASSPKVRYIYRFKQEDYFFELDTDKFYNELYMDKNTAPYIKAMLIKEYLADKIIQ